MKDHSVDDTKNLEHEQEQEQQNQKEEEELPRILVPNDLPLTPPSAVQSNFVSYFAPGIKQLTKLKLNL